MQLPPLDTFHTLFNFKIAKIIATFLVFFFIVYHGILHAIDGKLYLNYYLSNLKYHTFIVGNFFYLNKDFIF